MLVPMAIESMPKSVVFDLVRCLESELRTFGQHQARFTYRQKIIDIDRYFRLIEIGRSARRRAAAIALVL